MHLWISLGFLRTGHQISLNANRFTMYAYSKRDRHSITQLRQVETRSIWCWLFQTERNELFLMFRKKLNQVFLEYSTYTRNIFRTTPVDFFQPKLLYELFGASCCLHPRSGIWAKNGCLERNNFSTDIFDMFVSINSSRSEDAFPKQRKHGKVCRKCQEYA